MPIELITTEDVGTDEQSVAALLEQDGKPTLQAEVLERFLSDVDFDDVFEAMLADDEAKEFVTVEEKYGKWDAELACWIECEEGDEGAELIPVQTIDPEVAEHFVDLNDLAEMFDFYMMNEHNDETMQGKLEASIFGYSQIEMTEDGIDEKGPFKKGDFRKIHKQQGGPEIVNRMLGAMLNKEAIQRAPGGPSTGYKKGDYAKNPAGYGAGTSKGLKKWAKYKKSKAAAVAKSAKKTKKKVSVGGKKIGGVKKKAKAKKGAAAAKKAKGAKAKATKSKKNLAASVEQEGANLSEHESMPATRFNPNVPVVTESTKSKVSLLGKMGKHSSVKPLAEAKK